MLKFCITALLLVSSLPLQAAAQQAATQQATIQEDIKMFPAAEPGAQRLVIRLPKLDDEASRKVEILLSKRLMVDCNRQRLGGALQQKTLQGWGYSYYQLDQLIGPMSTLMACPNDTKKAAAVPVGGEGYLVRYNSRLPIVLYVPQGLDVQYRIWQPGESLPASVE
jgi:ecotin